MVSRWVEGVVKGCLKALLWLPLWPILLPIWLWGKGKVGAILASAYVFLVVLLVGAGIIASGGTPVESVATSEPQLLAVAPTKTGEPTATPVPATATTVPATATPTDGERNVSSGPAFEDVCPEIFSLGGTELENHVNKLQGQRVEDWRGWVHSVQEFGATHKLLIAIEPPGGMFWSRDIEIVVPEDVALRLTKEEEIVFSGTIREIGTFLGSICNPLELEDFKLTTSTFTAIAPTRTPIPPTSTATETPLPTVTFTPAPPTETFTPAPPTATFTMAPPTSISTVEPLPTRTSTPMPATTTFTPLPAGPVVNANANLRSGPSTAFNVVGQTQPGQAITVIAQNGAGDWYQLDTGAWIAGFLVDNAPDDLAVAEMTAPVVEETPPVVVQPTATPIPVVAAPTQANPQAFTCNGGCATAPDPSCSIKGNVNSSGERIYHVPGGQFYSRTDIKPEEGDRWFCSSAEATQAGFRASQR